MHVVGQAGQITMATQHEDGFTLVEVLLVIMILGMLSLVVTFSVTGISSEAQASSCGADARALSVGAESYFAQWSVDSIAPAGTDADRFERTLVDRGFLLGTSALHDIDAGGRLVQVPASPCTV